MLLWVVALGRELGFVAPLDARPYRRAVREAAATSDLATLRRLAEAGEGAWLARVTAAFADPSSEGVEGVLLALRYEATHGLRSLRVLGRVSGTVGILGALGAMLWLLRGDHGLAGLAAGLPEAMARSWAVASMARGFATGLFAAGAAALLQRRARGLLAEARDLADALQATSVPAPSVDPGAPAVLESGTSAGEPLSQELPGAPAVSSEGSSSTQERGFLLASPEDLAR